MPSLVPAADRSEYPAGCSRPDIPAPQARWQERIFGVLDGVAVADDRDRKLAVTVVRLHLVIPAHGKVDRDRPRPRGSNRSSVSCRMAHCWRQNRPADESADAGHYGKALFMVSVPRTSLEVTVTSLDTVETRRVRGLSRRHRINFAKLIALQYLCVWRMDARRADFLGL